MNINRLVSIGTAVLVILGVFLLVEINKVWNTATTTNTVSFNGEGKVNAKPDIAVISAGVMTTNVNSKVAQDTNARKSQAVVDFLKKNGIDEKDIKTSDYNIYPQYDYRTGSQGTILSYQVSENFQIKVRDLTKLSSILSGVVSAGANQVNNLGLQIEDQEKLKAEARTKAIEMAKQKAGELKGQVGIKLGRIVGFDESSNSGGPIYYDAVMKSGMGGGGTSNPAIAPGQNEIVVYVTLTYQIR